MPEIPNVIAGETIEADTWGNPIRDRTVQRYASVSERTSLHSSPSPGDLSFLEDSGDLDVFFSGQWRHLGVPTGTIVAHGGTVTPDGWLVCNGAAVSRTTYSTLFSALGITYGAGDGTSTFNLPDLRQRFPIGKAAAGTGSTLGGTGGAIDHAHSTANHVHAMSPHTHSLAGHTHTVGATGSGGGGGDTSLAGSHGHSFSDSFSTGGSSSNLDAKSEVSGPSFGTSSHTHSGSVSGTTGTASSHSHTIPNHSHSIPTTGASSVQSGDASSSIGDTGSGGAGSTGTNNPPFLVVSYIVKT